MTVCDDHEECANEYIIVLIMCPLHGYPQNLACCLMVLPYLVVYGVLGGSGVLPDAEVVLFSQSGRMMP